MSGSIAAEVSQALTRCREMAHYTPAQMAREVNRIVGGGLAMLDAEQWSDLERREMEGMPVEWLIAAARVAGQTVSAALGEDELLKITLPLVSERLTRVERELARRREADQDMEGGG